jgi:hypothetical protein
MNRRDARRYVCRVMATILDEAAAGNADWPFETPGDTKVELGEADEARVNRAIRELRAEMNKRGK